MTRILQLIVLLTLSFPTFATLQKPPINSPDFTYRVQNHPHLSRDVNALLPVFDDFFADRNLKQIFLPEGFSETRTSLSTITRIYSGDLGNTVVFIRAGVVPSLSLLMEKSVQIGQGYLHHFKQANGLVVAIFVKTESWGNAFEIFSNLNSKFLTVDASEKQSFNLINSAYAEDCPLVSKDSTTQDKLAALATTAAVITSQSSPIQHITGCTMSALKGVWNGSGGAITEGLKSFGEFVMSPVESGKRYWESATKLWDVTKHFFC